MEGREGGREGGTKGKGKGNVVKTILFLGKAVQGTSGHAEVKTGRTRISKNNVGMKEEGKSEQKREREGDTRSRGERGSIEC